MRKSIGEKTLFEMSVQTETLYFSINLVVWECYVQFIKMTNGQCPLNHLYPLACVVVVCKWTSSKFKTTVHVKTASKCL